MLTVRPKVAELTFQLFGRALHPELFEVYQSRVVERGGYQAKIDITGAGHVVTWRYEGLTLTEVATSSQHPLPQRRRLMTYKLRGARQDQMECRGGVKYDMQFQLETVSAEHFWLFQQELSKSGGCQGMLQRFDDSGRLTLGAVSYVNAEIRNRSLLVQAVHTFPADFAIVKSQSVFQLPG